MKGALVALVVSCAGAAVAAGLPGAAVAPRLEARDGPPAHLVLAREIVTKIAPQDNRYRLGGRTILLPQEGHARYGVEADCTGFLLGVLERVGYRTESRMVFLRPGPKRIRPRAEDFVLSIEQERGFARLDRIGQVRAGDVLAHAMLNREDQALTKTTGHVFLIDAVPRRIAPKDPIVRGTTQFEVAIIDTNDEVVGSDDTRLSGGAVAATGVGRGTIRVYADADGRVVGWSRTFRKARFFSYDPRFPSATKARKVALGRPLPG